MITRLHVLMNFWIFLLCVSRICALSAVEINGVGHKLLTPNIVPRDIEAAFDNDQSTQALIHSEKDEKMIVLITLPAEYEIKTVEIVSDLPASLKQTIQVGYAQDNTQPSPTLHLNCVANRSATLCQPHCGQGTQGVAGTTILWTLERIEETGWTRVYDVVIRGTTFEQQVVVQDKLADVALLKPYRDHGSSPEAAEECDKPVWKLIDSSAGSSTQPPIISTSRNFTVYFGQTYSIAKVGLIMGQAEETPSEITFHFGGRTQMTKTLSLSSDCGVEQSDIGLQQCTIDDLAGYPFTDVTFNVKGLVKVHVYGMPFYYPQIGIIPSEKHASPESEKKLNLTCVAMSCGQTTGTYPRAYISHPTSSSCSRYGRPVNCEDLELLRMRIPLPDESNDPIFDEGTLLISQGEVLPGVSQTMTELSVVKTSKSELIVSMPRTHRYYGQYKCRCRADDTISSILESPPTQLTVKDFDLDFVFQRNYTALSAGEETPAELGFLELKPDDQDAFFRLMVEGHSLTDKLELNVSYSESGNMTSITGDYAQTSVAEAFPKAENTEHAWPIPVYKVTLQEAWPDIADGEAIYAEWKTTDAEGNIRVLTDTLRIIVLTPEKDGTVRAWTWRRDASELDMRAYYQLGQSGDQASSKRIYLQRKGCSAVEPERISVVVLSGTECEAESGADMVIIKRTEKGCAVQFKVPDPSSSDQYALYVESTDGTADKQLTVSAGMANNLEDEINATDISMKFVSIEDEPDAGRSQLNALVTIHSKAIVDSSGCHSMYLQLHPTWPVDEQLEKRVEQADTAFTFAAPRDQKLLVLDLELRIDLDNPDSPQLRTRRSLTIPHPMAYQIELNVNKEQGKVTWSALPAPFVDLLQEFQAKVSSLIRACGSQVDLPAPAIHEEAARNYRDPTTYQIRLDEIPEVAANPKLLADYEVTIVPIFKGTHSKFVLGAPSVTKFVRGQLGQTTIKVDEVVTARDRRIFITPSQIASCLSDAPFTVNHELQVIGEGDSRTPSYLSQVSFGPDPNSSPSELGRWYIVNGLQPGRRYELKASVQYVSGEKDQESAFEGFWTKDEISIPTQEEVVSPGERVSVNCVAAVGPADANQKRVEWKRADGTPLPDGGRTEVVSEADEASEWRQTVSLIFDKVEQGQGTTYGCFVEPSVEQAVGLPVVVPKFKLIVSEMELGMNSKVASLGESVQVRCTSKQADQLVWMDPESRPLPVHESQDDSANGPYVTAGDETESGQTAVLHIPNVKLAYTGDYICRHPTTQSERVFRLRMAEEIHLNYDDESSAKSGQLLKLQCMAKSGQRGQQLIWYKRTDRTESWIPVAGLLEQDSSIQMDVTSNEETNEMQTHLSLINSPETNAQFGCALLTASEDHSAPIRELPETSAHVVNIVQPVIHLNKMPSTNDQEVLVKCRGYPAHSSDRLQWVFLPEGDETKAIPIGHGSSVDAVGDDELASKLKSTFRLGDNTPATWPGASGPQLLAAAGRIVTRNAEAALATPEQLELILHKPEADAQLDERLRTGSIACQYRRPKSVVVMEGSVPMFAVPAGVGDGAKQDVLVQEIMTLPQVLDPKTQKEVEDQLPVAVAGSGVLSGDDNNKDSTGNWAIQRVCSPLLVHALSLVGLICWRLWF